MNNSADISPPLRFQKYYRYMRVSAFILIFTVIAVLLLCGLIQELDDAVLLTLRNADLAQPRGAFWLLPLLRFITWFGDFPALLFAAVFGTGVMLFTGEKKEAAILAFSAIVAVLTMLVLKAVFARPRPDVIPALADVQFLSFPSGHAMMSVVLYVPLAVMLMHRFPRKKRAIAIILILFLLTIGFSRLYLGVHFLSDVLAGWAAGLAVLTAFFPVKK